MVTLDIEPRLSGVLDDRARQWWNRTGTRLRAEGKAILPLLFPALARSIGKHALGGGRQESGEAKVDLDRWRACDAAGFVLVRQSGAGDTDLADLFRHGDFEERTIVMRCLGLLEVRPVTAQLFGEAQRTNTQTHFEACVCDSNLLARAIGRCGITRQDAYRILLKAAFVDLPLARFFDILDHASPELSRMVVGLATEREAAGRAVWADTNRVIAKAPVEGTTARIGKGLDHADERHRLASAEALMDLADPELLALAEARLAREPSARVQAALERALSRRRN